MTDLDTEEPVSDLCESSFVILGQGSLPLHTNDEIMEASNLSTTTNHKVLSGFESNNASVKGSLGGSDFSEENIQKKLNELVKENYQLKETLSQNNLAIKSQLDSFFMWQQEVLKTHQTHKEKFLETKDLILKLRAENTNLKNQLEESLVTASGNDEIYSQVNKKPEEFEKIKEYKKIYNDLINENVDLNTEILKLREELKTKNSEILKLNSELENLGRDNTYLKQRSGDFNRSSVDSMSHRSLPNSEARVQISNLLKQLDEEKSKVLKLKEDLKKIKLSNAEASGTKTNTVEELRQYIENLNDINVSLDMQNQRFSSLQSWVSLAEETLKENKIHTAVECNLLCEINDLKTHLSQEENVSREKQETLQELREKFTVLLDDYKILQQKLNIINNKDTDIEKYKEKISNLSVQLEAKDKELKLKLQECNNLKVKNEELNLNCEEIAILRAQVEVYQTDFNDERKGREKLAGEKEELKRQVRHLQRQIKTLEQDIPRQKNESETLHLESSGTKTPYKCPQCMASLSDETLCLYEHMQECSNSNLY